MDVRDPAEVAAAFDGPPTSGQEELDQRLRAAGLRVTRPRLLVYETLARLGGHRSADDVYAAVTAGGATLARGSVYASLAVLARVGAVVQAETGAGAALFEVSDRRHDHLVCRVCGQVSDVPQANVPAPRLDTGDSWGTVEDAQVIFRGVCATCLAKTPGSAGGFAATLQEHGGSRIEG